MKSELRVGGHVEFPEFRSERIYMRPFLQKEGLVPLWRHWQPTIDAMLAGIETDETIYLMIDQTMIRKWQCHRRPGLHVDGNWNAGANAHTGHQDGDYHEEMIILASDVSACRALIGEFEGHPWPDGDCSDVATAGLREVIFEDHRVYRGNATLLHESLPVLRTGPRTLVRLNLPHVKLDAEKA